MNSKYTKCDKNDRNLDERPEDCIIEFSEHCKSYFLFFGVVMGFNDQIKDKSG